MVFSDEKTCSYFPSLFHLQVENHIFVNELHIPRLTGIAGFALIQTASKIKSYTACLSGPDLG